MYNMHRLEDDTARQWTTDHPPLYIEVNKIKSSMLHIHCHPRTSLKDCSSSSSFSSSSSSSFLPMLFLLRLLTMHMQPRISIHVIGLQGYKACF